MLTLKDVNLEMGGNLILDNINLNFDEGYIYILTGPNGGGKTSIGKVITALYPLKSGSIYFNGDDISKKGIDERANLGISYGFQTPIYFKGLTVKDLLILSSNNDDVEFLYNLLSKVGLCAKKYLDRELDNSLSGGELKRIEIASVLAKENTQLYIFDEPEAGIDLWSFKELITIFKKLKKEKKTIIIISHQEKILELSDFIYVINKGKITKFDTKEKILSTLIKREKEYDCEDCLKKEVM